MHEETNTVKNIGLNKAALRELLAIFLHNPHQLSHRSHRQLLHNPHHQH
jgi:hypothetical protein